MAVRLVWDYNALYQIRSDPALVAEEEAVAERVAAEANRIGKGTYAVGSRQGVKRPQGRWRTTVVTADARAMANNAKHNTLITALGSA